MRLTLEALKGVLNVLNVGIVLVGNDDKILLFNRIAGEMLQQDSPSRIGTSILRCHGEVSEPNVRKMLSEIRSGSMQKYEGWVDFRGRMLYEHIYPVRNDRGECILVVEELHDSAEKAEYLKIAGQWKDIHVSGVGMKAPRSPRP
ncbi:MAG: hypothetical protein C4K49_09880 [Candidatus Thorarchaeota archaeon]|nr:MAG: hypothetical protein C4K49_09880 [Candidatus Thorarchaeota archaeon]